MSHAGWMSPLHHPEGQFLEVLDQSLPVGNPTSPLKSSAALFWLGPGGIGRSPLSELKNLDRTVGDRTSRAP